MSDDGCGCLLALVAAGAIGYGAWMYFGGHADQGADTNEASLHPVATVATQKSPGLVVGGGGGVAHSVRSADPDDREETCAVIRRVPVESSAIRSIGYCRAKRTLEVEFTRGSVYRYWGVSEGTYDAFLAAPSKGQFFQAAIKSQPYGYARIR